MRLMMWQPYLFFNSAYITKGVSVLHNYHTTAINTEVYFSFTYGLTFNLQSQVLRVGPIFENLL